MQHDLFRHPFVNKGKSAKFKESLLFAGI